MNTTALLRTVAAALVLAGAALAQTQPAKPSAPAPSTPPAPAPTPAAPAKPVDLSPIVAEGIVNAPPAEVWKVFSTAEGFKLLGPAHAEIDLRIGGLIRSHYKPEARLGQPGTITNRILAFEPGRMMTIQIDNPPNGFPFMNVYQQVWTVMTITDVGGGRTHLRIAGHGFTAEEESQRMREFFRTGNQWTLDHLRKHFDASVQLKDITVAHRDTPNSPTAPIEIAKVVNAPRDAVYKTYTTSNGWKTFFGAETKIEARPGGPFEIYFSPADATPGGGAGERGSEGCTVLSLIPDEMFSYTWNAPPKLPFARTKHSWVVVTFEALSPTSTTVRVRHLGFDELAKQYPDHAAEFAETRAYFASAWPMVLGQLAGFYEPDVNK